MKTLHSFYGMDDWDHIVYYEDEEGAEERFPEEHEMLYLLERLYSDHADTEIYIAHRYKQENEDEAMYLKIFRSMEEADQFIEKIHADSRNG